jgi:ubiquinone/menaquinone biosynthesis C-methylase UbiE
MQNINLPFRIEEKRDQLSKQKKYRRFSELYSRKFPSISNKNTGNMWDKLNFSRKNELNDSPIYRDKLKNILLLLNKHEGNLLDVGFGSGVIEKQLNKSQFNLYGIDISKKSVNNLKKSVRGMFVVADILKIPFKSIYFDCIICLDVTEHISPYNTFKALNEIKRLLKHGGVVIISVPLNEGLEEMVKKGMNPNAHVRVYTPNILKTELKITGFSIQNEVYRCAFSKHYFIKNLVNNVLKIKKPNLLVIKATKK